MDGAVGTSSASTSASDCWMARASARGVFGLEGIQRAVAPGLFDDAAHHRVDRAGCSRHKASTAANRSATHGPWYSSAASSA